jgi:hypothetical protein
MSAVPPNFVGPILQSHLTQRQVSQVRDKEEVQRSEADRRNAAAIDEQDSTVETTDNDTQVHTDAEGAGSQGRAFTEAEEAEEEQAEESTRPTPFGPTGRNIDFEA